MTTRTPRAPSSPGVPSTEVHEERSEVNELPVAEQPAARMREIKVTTQQTKNGVDELRSEMKQWTERDLDEHAEIRTEIRGLRDDQKANNAHIADLRVVTAGMAGDVRRLADTQAETKKHSEEKKADKREATKFRRGLLIAAMGLGSALLGFLAHAAGFHC